MKKSALAAVLATALLPVSFAHAQPAGTADKGTQQQKAPAAPDVVEFDKQLAQAQENMKKMQEQMAKLQTTQDPKEREKLLQEHWSTMQAGMGLMNGMMGCMGGPAGYGMMGPGMMMGGMMGNHMMGWGNMSGYYSNLTPEQLKQRQYMMDQYRNVQQQMMSHMMWHQNSMWGQPPK